MEIQNSEFRIQKVSRGNGELKRENGKGCSSAKNGQMGEFGALTARIPSEFEQAVPPRTNTKGAWRSSPCPSTCWPSALSLRRPEPRQAVSLEP